jgi:DNA-binding HxlR family transcriptional regulator
MRQKCDVLNPDCPSRQVLDRIADKWTALIIYALSDGTHRYSELQRRIGGVSQKMLTQTLRSLEDDGLIERKVYPVVPPMVEYSLTPLGSTLTEPLSAICQWAEKHLPQLLAVRNRSESRRKSTNKDQRRELRAS